MTPQNKLMSAGDGLQVITAREQFLIPAHKDKDDEEG